MIPCSERSSRSRSSPNVPAPTSTSDPSRWTPRTPCSEQQSRLTPPKTGIAPPQTPLRPPVAVTGMQNSLQQRSTPATSAVSAGRTTTPGRAGTEPESAHLSEMGHQSRPDSANEPGEKSRTAQVAARRSRKRSSIGTRSPPNRSRSSPAPTGNSIGGTGAPRPPPTELSPPAPARAATPRARWRRGRAFRCRRTSRSHRPFGRHPAKFDREQFHGAAGRGGRRAGVEQEGPRPA